MKKLFVAAVTTAIFMVGSPAMASLVNVNTNNTLHPNNNLRCSGNNTCTVVDSTVDATVEILP